MTIWIGILATFLVFAYGVTILFTFLALNPRRNTQEDVPSLPDTDEKWPISVDDAIFLTSGRFYLPAEDVTIIRSTEPIYSVRAVCEDHADKQMCLRVFDGMDGRPIAYGSGQEVYYLYGAAVLNGT